ncbi:type II toxin-antitoxin system RelE/ParE family toxin [Pseudomonas gingeri]
MKVVWRPMALTDRETIMEHIGQDNLDAALRLDENFELKAEHARLRPMLYKKGRVAGTREIVVLPNDVMVYSITDDSVEILRVMHARQKRP